MLQKRYLQHTKKEKEIIIERLTNYLQKESEKIKNILEQMNPLVSIKKEKIIIPKTTIQRIYVKLVELS